MSDGQAGCLSLYVGNDQCQGYSPTVSDVTGQVVNAGKIPIETCVSIFFSASSEVCRRYRPSQDVLVSAMCVLAEPCNHVSTSLQHQSSGLYIAYFISFILMSNRSVILLLVCACITTIFRASLRVALVFRFRLLLLNFRILMGNYKCSLLFCEYRYTDGGGGGLVRSVVDSLTLRAVLKFV